MSKILKDVQKPLTGRGIAPRYPLLAQLKPGEATFAPIEERNNFRSAARWVALQNDKPNAPNWEIESWTGKHPEDETKKVVFVKRLS